MVVAALWTWSSRLHRSGHRYLALVLKGGIFLFARALLPPEAELGKGIQISHHCVGTVVHPNVVIGDHVRIFHGVTLGTDIPLADPRRLRIGDHSVISPGAAVVGPVDIGAHVVVGANAVVVDDVPACAVVAGNPARIVGWTNNAQSRGAARSAAAREHAE